MNKNNLVDVSKILLRQAIDYGLKHELFNTSFLDEVREEGAKMTVYLASEFYNAHYEAYLRQSADIIMGVCNLGAILWSKNDVQKTAFLLREKGLTKLFRKGYTAIKKLAKKAELHENPIDRISSKTCSEYMMETVDEVWSGYVEYTNLNYKANQRVQYLHFLKWFTRKYGGITTKNKITQLKIVETGLLSLIVCDNPETSLSLKAVRKILNSLVSQYEKSINLMYKFISDGVPKKFQFPAKQITQDIERRMCKIVNEGNVDTNNVNIFVLDFNVKASPDKIIRMARQAINLPNEDIFDEFDEFDDDDFF